MDLDRLRTLAEAADGGWGPDGWYSEHELRRGLAGTSTDLAADVAYLRAAQPTVLLALVHRLAAAEALAADLAAFDCATDPVPGHIAVPDDYESGLHQAAARLSTALRSLPDIKENPDD